MKNSLRILKLMLVTPALVLLAQNSRAQAIQEIQNSFNLYKRSYLQEKVFVHTDKTTYLPGELIWFKVYCVDGDTHKPLDMSKVVYVEVLDNSQTPVIQGKIAMKNGIGNGSFYVPVTVNSGNYKLRAYTSWMKNFGPDFYFEKGISFVNPLKAPDNLAKSTANTYDVQFFPEGGNLVGGIESKVGFKAVGADGKGAGISGAIIGQNNDTVARFKSLKLGMGNFTFTPAPGNAYKAAVKLPDGTIVIKTLPAVNSQGYVMKVSDNGSQLTVNVNGIDGPVYLFAHTRQATVAAQTNNISNGKSSFTLNKSTLGDGITSITIFNSAKQPVCERLYFKRPVQKLFIDASADQQQYGLRKKVNVNVAAKGAASAPVNASLSMAVYRVDSLQDIDRTNIFDYLWLTSDLKGSIESPDYYFNNSNAETDEALDNLMLTQGWRRFQWNQLLENRKPVLTYLPEFTGHIVTAKIINTQTNAPATDVMTYIGVPGKRVQVYTSQSDSLGRLLYSMKDFYGPGELVAQTNELIDSTYRIDVATPFSEQYSKSTVPAYNFVNGTQNALQSHSLGIQVLNLYSANSLKRFYDPGIDSSGFFGKPYKSYKLDDFTRFTTMEEDLREYVSEDNIVRSKGKFHIKVLNENGFLDGDPMVIFDGVPVFDVDKIFSVDPLKVRRLDVIRNRFYYGPAEQEGVFSFVTYKGDLGGLELNPHAVVIDYEGLQLSRQFYSPVYDTEQQAASRLPDFRNLLYWAPNLTSQNKVSFYTSGLPGKYVGVVQGLTGTGDAASQYFTFEVK